MASARHWDARLHSLVGGLPDTPADAWLRRLTTAADHGRLWMAVGALLSLRRGALRRGAVRGLASMAVSSGVVNAALKPVFGRRRPDLGAHPVHRLLHEPLTTHSFPSGHSSSAGAFVTGVALECPAAGAALAPLAVAVGYSRVHVGVHYPGDVVVGLVTGAAVAVGGRHWWPVRPTEPARVRAVRCVPALPGGEGLVVAVNPRSGAADYDPVLQVRRLLPRAEVRELRPGVGVEDLLQDAVRAGGVRALGVAGGDGSVASAAVVSRRSHASAGVSGSPPTSECRRAS
ncbi:MAG TPA: phosphatase PAP2 family protein, partial [Geodermatophilus sp.]|nr:phosphatase PAP2 family protein [Geodermatophilus sp.]